MTIRACLLLATLLIAPSITTAQTPPPPAGTGTYADTVMPDVHKRYVFTTTAAGQLTATLSWDDATSNLMVVMICIAPGTDTEPLTFGIAAGQLDRTARFEAGVFGGLTCLLQVTALAGSAAYRLNVQMSTDQLASPYSPLRVSAARNGDAERRLHEHAAATARALQLRRR